MSLKYNDAKEVHHVLGRGQRMFFSKCVTQQQAEKMRLAGIALLKGSTWEHSPSLADSGHMIGESWLVDEN